MKTRTVEILYEDDHYVVADKPAGLLVIPSPRNETTTLVILLNRQYASAAGSWKLHPCHRLDRDTSGAIIFAKGKQNQKRMMDVFHRRVVVKKYVAFVHGRPALPRGEFRRPVRDVHRAKFRKKFPAVPALTRYRVTRAGKRFSVVEVEPVTGRTNQIRIHFAQAGHPLLGERLYALARDYPLKFRRTALHAASLAWTHPVTGRKVAVEAELPKDMREFLTTHH